MAAWRLDLLRLFICILHLFRYEAFGTFWLFLLLFQKLALVSPCHANAKVEKVPEVNFTNLDLVYLSTSRLQLAFRHWWLEQLYPMSFVHSKPKASLLPSTKPSVTSHKAKLFTAFCFIYSFIFSLWTLATSENRLRPWLCFDLCHGWSRFGRFGRFGLGEATWNDRPVHWGIGITAPFVFTPLEALVGDESDERLKSLIHRERFVSVLKTPTTPRSLPSQLLQPEFPSSASTFSVAQVVKPRMNGTWMEYQPVHMFLYWTTTITLVSALKPKSCNPSTSRRSLQWCAKMLNGGMDGVSVKRCWVKIRISLICPDPRRQTANTGHVGKVSPMKGTFTLLWSVPTARVTAIRYERNVPCINDHQCTPMTQFSNSLTVIESY